MRRVQAQPHWPVQLRLRALNFTNGLVVAFGVYGIRIDGRQSEMTAPEPSLRLFLFARQRSPITVVRDEHFVVASINYDSMRIGQFGFWTAQHSQRRFAASGFATVDHHFVGVLN